MQQSFNDQIFKKLFKLFSEDTKKKINWQVVNLTVNIEAMLGKYQFFLINEACNSVSNLQFGIKFPIRYQVFNSVSSLQFGIKFTIRYQV